MAADHQHGGTPAMMTANAWAGTGGASGRLIEDSDLWGARSKLPREPARSLFPERPPELTDWLDPRVGWGLIAADNANLDPTDLAVGADLPEPLRELLRARRGIVLRYQPAAPGRHTSLTRYMPDGSKSSVINAAAPFGVGADAIPYYLLIAASPAVIPWELQYALNARSAVGRLDLSEQGLARYVGALLTNWADAASDSTAAVIWATDHGDTITTLMKDSIARPLFDRITNDADLRAGSVFVGAAEAAEGGRLLGELGGRRPRLVVTTSHGDTDPTAGNLAARLGRLIDQAAQPIDVQPLLDAWQPDGAIWYSHACCSAGASRATVYDSLFDRGSDVVRILAAAQGCGDVVSPLPTALLSHERPLRAFVGHVEPTFDWTLRAPETGDLLTSATVSALYDGIYQTDKPCPIGHAFRKFFSAIGTLSTQQISLRRAFDNGEKVGKELLATQLAARDRMSTVILGDPAVTIGLETGSA